MQRNMEFVREVRSALDGPLTYAVTADESAAAAWVDVSRVGVGIALGRYLRPGRVITLSFSGGDGSAQVSLQARVVWCRQVRGSAEFHAGLQVVREHPGAALAFARLVHTAREATNTAEGCAVQGTVWPNFRQLQDYIPEASRQPQQEAAEYIPRAV